jgi:hypothetical protein
MSARQPQEFNSISASLTHGLNRQSTVQTFEIAGSVPVIHSRTKVRDGTMISHRGEV